MLLRVLRLELVVDLSGDLLRVVLVYHEKADPAALGLALEGGREQHGQGFAPSAGIGLGHPRGKAQELRPYQGCFVQHPGDRSQLAQIEATVR